MTSETITIFWRSSAFLTGLDWLCTSPCATLAFRPRSALRGLFLHRMGTRGLLSCARLVFCVRFRLLTTRIIGRRGVGGKRGKSGRRGRGLGRERALRVAELGGICPWYGLFFVARSLKNPSELTSTSLKNRGVGVLSSGQFPKKIGTVIGDYHYYKRHCQRQQRIRVVLLQCHRDAWDHTVDPSEQP